MKYWTRMSAFRGTLLLAAILATLALPGCGGEDPDPPEFTGTDEEQVAATVNALLDAFEVEDEEAMCALMSERGQQLMMLTAGELPQTAEVVSCEAAMAVLLDEGFDPKASEVGTGDVDISPETPNRAEANCDYGAFILERPKGPWRVVTPYCAA